MTTQSTDDRPDTHEMVVIHRIFRQGFALLADAADRVPSAESGRAGAVARHVEFMLDALHHHAAEDAHLWPRLAERVEPDAVNRLLPRWRSAPAGPELADGLQALGTALTPYLDEEEARILPLIRSPISASEWQQTGEAAGFLRTRPRPVRLIWRLAGRRRYDRHMRTVLGTR